MNPVEKLHEIYRAKGPVNVGLILKLIEEEGYRVGLPGGVVARTLYAEISASLIAGGGIPLLDEEAVRHFREEIFMKKINFEDDLTIY